MIELGYRRLVCVLAIVLIGGSAAAVAWLGGSHWTIAAGVAAAAMAPGAVGAVLMFRSLHRRVVEPMTGLLEAIDADRRRDPSSDHAAAPLIQTVLRRVDDSQASFDERHRLSEAKILSAEAAFDRIHAVVQSLAEGVIVADEHGHIVLANQAARAVLEDSRAPVEGQPLVDLVSGHLEAAVRRGTSEIDRGIRTTFRAANLHHQDRVFDVSIVTMQGTDGTDLGRVIVLTDITETHEISRLKDELLSSISHELKTPLTNICSSIELLAQLSPDEELEWDEFYGMARQESVRLKDLVDAVIYYSQIETGQIEWMLDEFDLHDLIRNALAALTPTAARRRIEVTQTFCDGPLSTFADHSRVQDVLVRLLDNALKFTPDGGHIEVSTNIAGDDVTVTVADSGKGVPPEHRERVFDRFAQLGDFMTDKPQGTGLGLAICRRILESLGGTIDCDDAELGGAAFQFSLPRAKVT